MTCILNMHLPNYKREFQRALPFYISEVTFTSSWIIYLEQELDLKNVENACLGFKLLHTFGSNLVFPGGEGLAGMVSQGIVDKISIVTMHPLSCVLSNFPETMLPWLIYGCVHLCTWSTGLTKPGCCGRREEMKKVMCCSVSQKTSLMPSWWVIAYMSQEDLTKPCVIYSVSNTVQTIWLHV